MVSAGLIPHRRIYEFQEWMSLLQGAFMALELYPNDADLQELDDAHALFATAGIAAGPGGYDVGTLAATAYARGWAYRIDRAPGGFGYRVEIGPQNGSALQPFVSAMGWEPEVALAFALAQALTRRATHGAFDRYSERA